MIQECYLWYALYFYYYYISFTPAHPGLDPGGWGPLYLNTIQVYVSVGLCRFFSPHLWTSGTVSILGVCFVIAAF